MFANECHTKIFKHYRDYFGNEKVPFNVSGGEVGPTQFFWLPEYKFVLINSLKKLIAITFVDVMIYSSFSFPLLLYPIQTSFFCQR